MIKRNYFNLIPLNYKLALLGIVPLVAMIFFFYLVEKEKGERINGANNFINRINFALTTDNLIEQLQQERRLSLSKLFNQNDEGALGIQQLKTDEALQQFEVYTDSGLTADYRAYTFIDELASWRTKISNGALSYQQIFNNYQKITERLKAYTSVSTDYGYINKSLGERMELREILSNMISYGAALRLTVYFAYANKQSNAIDTADFDLNYELLLSYIKQLNSLDKRYHAHYMEQLKDNSALNKVFGNLTQIYETKRLPSEHNGDEWWNISATAMDFLKSRLTNTINEISQNASQVYHEEISSRNFSRGLLIALAVLIILLLYLVIRNISVHLFELQEAATKIALGHINISLPTFARDNLGVVARAIRKIDINNQELAKVADEIGKENYAVQIIPKGKHDILGNALLNMKNSLEKHANHDKQELWIQAGENLINNLLIGRRELKVFGLELLTALTDYLEADIGTYYLLGQDQSYYLLSSIGLTNPEEVAQKIQAGQTLLGKVIMKKEAVMLTDFPDDYLHISTSLGSNKPTWILIVPLVHENTVEGIMEIASLNPAPDASLALAHRISKNIGSTIHAVKSRMQLKELLEETQTQAEELQTQQTELENLNVELEAQATKLQASEEELRVQQEELLEANQELEIKTQTLEEKNQVILERNLEIQKKAEDLELSTKYKSEFLANMSHELRTPLNSILLLSRLLSENNEGNLSDDQIEYAQVIQTSGNGLLTLIDEILDLSKIEAGKMTLNYEEVQIDDIITDLENLFKRMATDKGLEFDVIKATDLPVKLIVDNLRLQQILRNLISNALKFTAKGSVKVIISPNKEKKGFINFAVRDTGIGIPKEKQQLVFEAFQQADGSTRRKFGGTGLGLSISKELAKLLGGSLAINPEVTQGSEFIVNIPQKPLEKQEEKTEQTTSDSMGRATIGKETEQKKDNSPIVTDTKSVISTPFLSSTIPNELEDDRAQLQEDDKVILIIEDDTSFARALIDFSHQNNYKVVTTVRGDLGVTLAKQYRPQAILLDIELPIKNGWQVMDELKADPDTRHIPVHIMSSHEVKRESITKGAIDFIQKPMALEKIGQVFKRVEKALSSEPRKVLIIEDNIKHAQALAHYLESFEVKTDISKDIQSGIDKLKKHEADCVILDMGIPDAMAYRMLETIKSDAGMENLPIIIFTGKNLSPSEELKIKQYADSIVVKTAHSYERILDEVALFLHLIEENKGQDSTRKIKSKLNNTLQEILNNKTVLIADDDIRNIFSLTKALERYKIEVVTASDGKEALRLLKENANKIDIVLMDMMMPEMDGYETTRRIRQDKRFKNLPILAVTAKAMMGDREKCIAAGASDYISKPVDFDQLISLLRVWLYQ